MVDDSHLVRLRVKNALSSQGVEVHEMRRAEELLAAREVVAGADLVILDLYLPEMDGLTALEQLRRDKTTAKVPVMILSVASDPEHVRRAAELGVVDYVVKPFSDEELLKRVARIIGLQQSSGPAPEELQHRLETEVRKEVKRAKRAGTALSLLKVSLPPGLEWERLEGLRQSLAAGLRETDTCLPYPNGGLVLILPVTPREGAAVVREKVGRMLSGAGVGLAAFRVAVFPEDGSDEQALVAALEMKADETAAESSGSAEAKS